MHMGRDKPVTQCRARMLRMLPMLPMLRTLPMLPMLRTQPMLPIRRTPPMLRARPASPMLPTLPIPPDLATLSRMMHLATCQLIALVLFTCLFAGSARAEVPNKSAVPAYAEEQTILQTEKDQPSPGFMSRESGKVHIDRHYLGQYGATEGTVLVQRGGNTWRYLRNGPMATISGTLLLVFPLLLFGFYVAVGPARVDEPDTGRRLQRFDLWDRTIHWATAISFLLLAFSGLILLFGKVILIPLLGHDLFSWLAAFSKFVHNFVGPLFIVCSIVMVIHFARKNLFRRIDWQWLRQGGGLVSHKHVPADYFNAGEKLWFWGGVVLLGLLMSISGLVLDFVNLGQTRYQIQLAHYLHLTAGSLYMVAAMGHIFIGTLGTPGAYEAMRHGTVDESWAKAHHSRWYDELRGRKP
jgi:formate dehydrogenase subunit gamma